MSSAAIYRANFALISVSLSFVQVHCACDYGLSLSCPSQWWNSWYIWVFVGSLLTVILIVGLRFFCQKYRWCDRCCGRQMTLGRTQRQESQCNNDERRYEDGGISAYCIPLPPDYSSCSSSPPPYHVIFYDANKDRRPSGAELQLSQDLPSYEECVSNKSGTQTPSENYCRPCEGIETAGHMGIDVTDGRTLEN